MSGWKSKGTIKVQGYVQSPAEGLPRNEGKKWPNLQRKDAFEKLWKNKKSVFLVEVKIVLNSPPDQNEIFDPFHSL